MEIVINQKKIAIGDKYRIFINQQPSHTASRQIFQLLAEILLFNDKENSPRITINKRLSWFKPKYDISRRDGTKLAFRTKSYWKLHYQCQSGIDCYDIYGHKGRKYSIYKNDTQVAWLTKSIITWLEGDNYHITADDDSDSDLLIAFCLIIDHTKGNHGENALTINVGHVGFQAKKFNPQWLPKATT